MADVAKLCDELLSLTIMEAKELNDLLEEKGIKAAAAVAVAGPAGGGDAGGARGRFCPRSLCAGNRHPYGPAGLEAVSSRQRKQRAGVVEFVSHAGGCDGALSPGGGSESCR